MRIGPHVETQEEESYFVSMTDIMVGLVFVFVILLMFFAMRLQEATAQQKKESDRLQQVVADGAEQVKRLRSAEQDRDLVLSNLERALEARGVTVQIIRDEGVLRLPESILFDRAKADLLPQGQQAVSELARALSDVLPCFIRVSDGKPRACATKGSTIEAVLIEGHTDKDPLPPNHPLRDNLNLSAQRALNTFRWTMQSSPELLTYMNIRGKPIFSVSGYGEQRPINQQRNDEEKKLTRRIDLRILMSAPQSADAERLQDDILRGAIRR